MIVVFFAAHARRRPRLACKLIMHAQSMAADAEVDPDTAAPPHNPRLLLHVQMPKCPSAHWPRAQVLCKKQLSTPAASVGNSRTKGSMHISAPTSARFIPGVWNGLSAAVKKLGARRQGISSITSSTGKRARARPLGTLGWRRCWFLVTGRTT